MAVAAHARARSRIALAVMVSGGNPYCFRNLRNPPRSFLPRDLHPSAQICRNTLRYFAESKEVFAGTQKQYQRITTGKRNFRDERSSHQSLYSSLFLSLAILESSSWRDLKSRRYIYGDLALPRRLGSFSRGENTRDNHPGDKPGCGSAA